MQAQGDLTLVKGFTNVGIEVVDDILDQIHRIQFFRTGWISFHENADVALYQCLLRIVV
jgi:hypothetical protein